jgi:hypothetical protein
VKPEHIKSCIDPTNQVIVRHRIFEVKVVEKLNLLALQTVPSSIDLAEIRVSTTESRFAASLNRLLQQNLPMTEVET